MRRLGDLALKVYVALVLAVLYIPLFAMAAASFNHGRSLLRWEGLSLEWYLRALTNDRILTALLNSFWVASAVSLIAVGLALLAAISVDKLSSRIRTSLHNIFYLSIIVPEIAEALTLAVFFISVNAPLGSATVVLGHLVWFPLVYVVLRARMAGLPPTYEEAARVLGASGFRTFFHVTLPLLGPGIVTGGLLIFTWSWDSFIKTQFTRGPGFETLPVYIWNAVGGRGRGLSPEVNAVATLSIIVSIVLAVLYSRYRSRL